MWFLHASLIEHVTFVFRLKSYNSHIHFNIYKKHVLYIKIYINLIGYIEQIYSDLRE